ncbi:MAG TPA: DNA-directed RNA polymerase subunit omega [Acidobacteriaceae bacterium]|nr:DNA-directed RNA polymerase subunit omega [Acidobacteriaceae bacterium]
MFFEEQAMSVEQEFDSNFRYVMVAARRARQLQNGSPALVNSRSGKPCKVALDEIHAGKVGYVKAETPVLKPEVASPDIPKFAIS